MSTSENTPTAAPAAAPTPSAAPAAASPPAASRATKDQINTAIAQADAIVASIKALHATLNVNDTAFIAVTVNVAAERLQEAQRYLRNKLPKAQ